MQMRLLHVMLFAAVVPLQLPQASVPVNLEPRHSTRFENEVVRILEVAVPSRESTGFHEHIFDNVTVVLEGDEVTLQPPEGSPGALSITTGQVIYTGAPKPYTHRVANVGSTGLRLITVELLSRPQPSAPPTPTSPPGPVVLENERLRAWRLVVEPGQVVAYGSGALPKVRVVQSGGSVLETEGASEPRRRDLKVGDWQWHPGGVRRSLQNTGAAPIVVVDFEIL